jgi:molecular chaperone GrpE
MDLNAVQEALRSTPRIEDDPQNASASADAIDVLGVAAEFSKFLRNVSEQQTREIREIAASVSDTGRLHEALQREQERAAGSEQQLRKMAEVLIGTLDLFERMLAALSADPEMKPWETQTRQALELSLHNAAKIGFVALGTPGEAFDSSIHDLTREVPGGSAVEPRISAVLERGYALNGRILRRARVDYAE